MPQVDLDTLVSICSGGGGDRKIACEPLQAHAAGEQSLDDDEKKPDLPQPPDSPPESFWLSRDAEFDWFDRNAFYERKDSGKGSTSANLNPNLNPNLHPINSSSQRFSKNLKAKAKIIGLPKTQKASYVDANRRNCKKKLANARFFNSSNNKALVEPSSPKVSCIGRVRSKRGRKKVRSDDKKAVEKSSRGVESSRTSLYGRFMAIFRSKPRTGPEPPPTVEESAPRRSVEVRSSFRGEPPGLGGMTRFASGRRSASSWAGDE